MTAMADGDSVRIDKWLWAARFFKTRALAAQAVAGGKVHINGTRCKASHRIHPGESLRIRRGPVEFEITVCGVSERRGPFREARSLYEETLQSIRRREAMAAEHRQETLRMPHPPRRPGKRDRRRIMELQRHFTDGEENGSA